MNSPIHQWFIATRADTSTTSWRSGCFSWKGHSFALFAAIMPCAGVAPICVIQFPDSPDLDSDVILEETQHIQPRSLCIAGTEDVVNPISAVKMDINGCMTVSFKSNLLQLRVGLNPNYWRDTTTIVYTPDRLICWLPPSQRPTLTEWDTSILWSGKFICILRATGDATIFNINAGVSRNVTATSQPYAG